MNKFSIARAGLLTSLLATAASADSFWTGTLPHHAALCESGSSASIEDLGRALDGFAGRLANKGVVTIGFPFVRSMTFSTAADGAVGAGATGTWEICAPAAETAKAPAGFSEQRIEAVSVAALVCGPPVAGCARKLLTKLDVPPDSPRIASLRSAPLTRLASSSNFETAAMRSAALREVVRIDTVRVDGPDPASLPVTAPLPIDADFAEKRPPRSLYVHAALAGEPARQPIEAAVLVTIAWVPPQNAAADSPRASAPNP
jgi:hypothetical protein